MRRAGVSTWRHRGHVSRLEDEDSRGPSTASSRSHVDDNWHRGRLDLFNDFARGIEQTAGCIHLDQHGLVVVGACHFESAAYVFDGDRLDDVEYIGRAFEMAAANH